MFSPQSSPSVFCCSANSVRPSSSLRARIRVSTSPTRIEGFEESHLSVATSAGKFRPRGRFRSSQLVAGAAPSSSIRSTASVSSWKANSIRPSSSGRALTRARRSIPWSFATRSAANPAIRRAAKVATNSFVIATISSVQRVNAGEGGAGRAKRTRKAGVVYAPTATFTFAGSLDVNTSTASRTISFNTSAAGLSSCNSPAI